MFSRKAQPTFPALTAGQLPSEDLQARLSELGTGERHE
jgi:hypothetical protein